MLLSIVPPIYCGEKMLDELVNRIKASVSTITEDYGKQSLLDRLTTNGPKVTAYKLANL